ncbi:MAG: AMP-binding protein [Candidatus Nanopelagicales bacterium]
MTPLSPLAFLRRASDVHGDSIAVVDGDVRIAYRELRSRADRLADALRAEGVQPGDRVAVLAANGLPLLEAHYGVPGAQAVLVALNTRLGPDEYDYILRHCEPRILIVSASLADRVDASQHPYLARVVVIGAADGAGDDGYEAWLAGHADGPGMVDPAAEESVLAINYTSGTTGRPKGVMYTHRGAFLNALGTALTFGLTAGSVYLWTLPMFHCNGWCFTWSVTAMAGRHVCLPRPEPRAAVEAIEREGVTHFCAAPVVLADIVGEAQATTASRGARMRVATGGAPPSPRVIAQAEAVGIELTHLYGMTETYGPSLVCEPLPGWSGRPAGERATLMSRQGVRTVVVQDVRVVADDGSDVPADALTMGEIVVDSATVMAGYYRDPEATAEAMRGGVLHTGDLAVRHPDGYIEIRDRAKDIIISGGENISSIEVEHALTAHPQVVEAAVVAAADERWGQVPVAFVTLAPGATLTADDLRAFLRGRIAGFKTPRDIRFADLPKTATGKVQKSELRRRLEETV